MPLTTVTEIKDVIAPIIVGSTSIKELPNWPDKHAVVKLADK